MIPLRDLAIKTWSDSKVGNKRWPPLPLDSNARMQRRVYSGSLFIKSSRSTRAPPFGITFDGRLFFLVLMTSSITTLSFLHISNFSRLVHYLYKVIFVTPVEPRRHKSDLQSGLRVSIWDFLHITRN